MKVVKAWLNLILPLVIILVIFIMYTVFRQWESKKHEVEIEAAVVEADAMIAKMEKEDPELRMAMQAAIQEEEKIKSEEEAWRKVNPKLAEIDAKQEVTRQKMVEPQAVAAYKAARDAVRDAGVPVVLAVVRDFREKGYKLTDSQLKQIVQDIDKHAHTAGDAAFNAVYDIWREAWMKELQRQAAIEREQLNEK